MASNEVLAKVMKDLPLKFQTSSLKERKDIFDNVKSLLTDPEFTENVVRGLCELLQMALPRYRDSVSQGYLTSYIRSLTLIHPEWAFKHLTPVIVKIANYNYSLIPTKYTAQNSLYVLRWSSLLVTNSLSKVSEPIKQEIKNLINAQALLITSTLGEGNQKRMSKANHILTTMWKSDNTLITIYETNIVELPESWHSVVFGSVFVKYLQESQMSEKINMIKVKLLETIVKTIISSKTKVPFHITESCKPVLGLVTEDEFTNTILPSLQKFLLRNPEVTLFVIGKLISNLSIDLNNYALDFGKTVSVSLCSNDDEARSQAIDTLKDLASRCNDPEVISALAAHLFQFLNRSQGKIIVSAHKIAILQGIGNLSLNAVPVGKVQILSQNIAEQFIQILEVEVNEKTIIHCLNMMMLWCTKFTSNVPATVISWFEKGISFKNSSPEIRISYIEAMSVCCNSATISQTSHYIPLLLKSVETAAEQPTQVLIVSEGLKAACLLLKMSSYSDSLTSQLKPLYKVILNMEKQIFISERFISQASNSARVDIVILCEKLLMEHFSEVVGNPKPLYRALAFCLATYAVKSKCTSILNRMLSSLYGTVIATSILQEFTDLINDNKFQNPNKQQESINYKPRYLVDVITMLCSATNLSKDDQNLLAYHCILVCHHPLIESTQSKLWIKIIKHFKLNPKRFIKLYLDKISKLLIEDFKPEPSYRKALATIAELNPEAIVVPLTDEIKRVLSDPELLNVTQHEYEVFLSPPGELYDKSVLANQGNDSAINQNFTKESKVYSFKEQQEVNALRKELEEKKRKEGKCKAPDLTPKQKEIMKNQLEKEAVIRDKLALVEKKLIKVYNILISACDGAALAISLKFPIIIPLIVRSFNSALCTNLMSELYLNLNKVAFLGSKISFLILNRISHTSLSIIKAKCKPNLVENESLEQALNWAINEVYNISDKELTAPALTYLFPMIQTAINATSTAVNMQITGIQILSNQCKFRASGPTPSLHDPALLPRKQILTLCIDLIQSTSGKIQSQSSECVLLLAKASCGANGCAVANSEEIYCLLTALQYSSYLVREAALHALNTLFPVFPKAKQNPDPELYFNITKRIWVALHDVVEENRTYAQLVWNNAKLTSNLPGLSDSLLTDIVHPVSDIQYAAAAALFTLLKDSKSSDVNFMITLLLDIYNEKNIMIPAKLDNLGRIVEKPIDTWEPRSGVALALAELAPLLNTISDITIFFVEKGLGDRHSTVRSNMLIAASAVIDFHGKNHINVLLPILESVLNTGSNCSSHDAVREAVVILLGVLARHLDKDDPRIKPIVKHLVQALKTPSQQVQEAIANCLPNLVPNVKDEAPMYVQQFLTQLLDSVNYGHRRGAAYGLAGFVKGMGILVLKQYDVMTTLTAAIQNKHDYRHREGALFAFELLCNVLGRLFEPYIVHVLPHLLLCFGDSNNFVRTATNSCAKVVMSKLSAHGVKLILPSLLAALDKDSWRTKIGSVELLGAMAYCAPKQLSSCLPNIVPKLIEILNDSHTKVQLAGTAALKQIGSVIKNPEIQAIVPTLIMALENPSNKTAMCLQTLLDTKFVHFIDAPSLALIMPVVQRAFLDRSTVTRKMAAQIIGNMYSLTDQKDLTPYLPAILPGLKTSLLDPVPEVRTVSARALGAMVKGMGEASFEDLLPWLMKTLTSEASSVDRSGAAQGLSEVVGGLGIEKLHKLMPEIISTAERVDIAPHVKDGYIMMFIYMPVVFTKEFTPYIGEIIIPILRALADENEYVRETALKAGQRIVNLYAESAITLLLPELEKGLFDDNWRIRYSSVQLLGDLLYRISGVSGKMSTETMSEDDNFGTEQSHKAIIGILGGERRNRVLAGLYMGRSDVALMVRQAALHVWKVVVTNTPRTLKEILPTLFSLLLSCLASTSYDKRQVGAKTLGDIVRKLGERVLPDIIPILEQGLQSDQPDQRQGVCIGLSEMMASTSRAMVLTFVDSLVPTVRKALCDPLPQVRQAAAKAFDSLHSTVGVRALDDILPVMLEQLNNPDPEIAERTLDGLRQVMAVKSRVVLPYLIPQLTAAPINTEALSILACVAGESLTKYLPKILPALLNALADFEKSPQELEYCQVVVLTVSDETGIFAITTHLLEALQSNDVNFRRAAATLLCSFCTHTKADFSQFVPQLIRGLILSFTDTDSTVIQMSWEALSAVTKSLNATQQIQYVNDVRQAIKYAASDLKNGATLLPGLCLPKGIAPVLPLFRESILNGSPEIKESAAEGLGEVIALTTAQSLQPTVINITGPLIRILGDRFPATVKAAVLHTLAILLEKVGIMLKQFLPQLQTTFLKALNDGNRLVRLKAATALRYLITIHTRPDPLFSELHSSVENAEDTPVRETMLQALRGVVSAAGKNMSLPVLKTIYNSLLGKLSHSEDAIRSGVAGCFGALIRWLPDNMLQTTMNDHLLVDNVTLDCTLRDGRSCALFVALKEAPDRIIISQYQTKICKVISSFLVAEKVSIVMNGIRGCGYMFTHLMDQGETLPQSLLSQFVRGMNHSSNEVKQLLANVCSFLAKNDTIPPEFFRCVVPMLVNGTKEKNSYVKSNSELALVYVLKLKHGDTKLKEVLHILESGAAEALNDAINKVLRKVATQVEGKSEEIDVTLLT